MKKSYYKLALIYHLDRAIGDAKREASEKFNIIHNAYFILSDPTKKEMYDNGSNVLFSNVTIAARWENYLKPVSSEEMERAQEGYRGSKAEEVDLIREYVSGKGSLTYLLNTIPFMRVEDEDRIIQILKRLMETGKIPKMPVKRLRK